MTTEKFVKKMIRKTVIFVLLMIIVSTIVSHMAPIVSNQIALGQMQNSDEAFVIMNSYNNLKSLSRFVYVGISLWFTGTLARDTCIFIKCAKKEKEN